MKTIGIVYVISCTKIYCTLRADVFESRFFGFEKKLESLTREVFKNCRTIDPIFWFILRESVVVNDTVTNAATRGTNMKFTWFAIFFYFVFDFFPYYSYCSICTVVFFCSFVRRDFDRSARICKFETFRNIEIREKCTCIIGFFAYTFYILIVNFAHFTLKNV